MHLVFYSIVLNHHQAGVADELYKILETDFTFVELANVSANKGATEDYSSRPYLLKSWESQSNYSRAMELARSADACVFSGAESLPFEKERMKYNLLSFDMGERYLKRGWINLLSPPIFKIFSTYHLRGWRSKQIFKLACSGFTQEDCRRLAMFKDKCYKWGYFTEVDDYVADKHERGYNHLTKIMWCGRFISLKHPEMAVEMAKRLQEMGYAFLLEIYGDDKVASKYEQVYSSHHLISLISSYGLNDLVKVKGAQANETIIEAMRDSDIFIFTSNRLEGWGAVANESLASGCVLVASDAIGSSPYLIKDGVNGFMFENENVDSLTEKVSWLISHKDQMETMKREAVRSMAIWSPAHAAKSLLRLIDNLQNGKDTDILEGPCSKA